MGQEDYGKLFVWKDKHERGKNITKIIQRKKRFKKQDTQEQWSSIEPSRYSEVNTGKSRDVMKIYLMNTASCQIIMNEL